MAKNIYNEFDWEDYYRLLELAMDEEVRLVHTNYGMGGFTFAWKRESAFAKSRMIRVAISFCSPKDQFCRKIGAYNALNNWFNMEDTILLPVGDEDSAVIVARLRHTFGVADDHLFDIDYSFLR